MSPKSVCIQDLYKFSFVGRGKHLATMDNNSELWLISRNMRERFLRLKKELKEAIKKCPHYPCYTDDHACGYFGLEECPFSWAFKNGLIGGKNL